MPWHLQWFALASGLCALLVNAQDPNISVSGGISVNATVIRQCQPVTFKWDKGDPPFSITSVPYSTDPTSRGDVAQGLRGLEFTWMNTYPANTSVSFVVRDSKNAFGVVGAWVQPGPNTCSVRPTPTNAPNIGGVFSSMMSNLTALVEQATAAMGAGQLTTSSTSGSIIPSISTSNKPVDPYPYGFPDFPDEKKKSGPNIGAIVGGVVGGVGGLLLIIILFIFFWRRRKANSRSNYSGHPVDIDPPAGGGPMMTPYPASQAVTQSTAEANKDAEAQRLLAQRATSDSPTTEVSTPELLASKYQRFNSQTSDQMSSSGASSTSPLTGKRGEQLSVSTHSPTSPSPLPPIHQAAPPGLIRGDSYAVETAEDAGPLAAGEVLPPRYNPEWEQRARDSQTGN